MGIYRVFAGSDGESHMEELRLEEHPALGALTNIHEVRVQQFDGTRQMDFPPPAGTPADHSSVRRSRDWHQ